MSRQNAVYLILVDSNYRHLDETGEAYSQINQLRSRPDHLNKEFKRKYIVELLLDYEGPIKSVSMD